MVSKQKQRIFFNSFVLLSAILMTLVANVSAESGKHPTFTELLQRITSSQRQISYTGKRISIMWTPDGCRAREELVIHQPPSTHFVKLLTPQEENRWSDRRKGFRRRHKRLQNRERPDNARIKHRLEGRFFSVQRQQPIELMSQKDIERLSRNYTFQYTPAEEIAGHETDLLTIQPQVEGRPMKHIWIAKDKGTILRLEDLDSQGNLRFLSVYTQFSFQPEHVRQRLTKFKAGRKSPIEKPSSIEVVPLPEAEEVFGRQLILPTYLPQGFELQNVSLMKFRSKPPVHVRYTDGLMAFSLFEESRGRRPSQQRIGDFMTRGGETQQIHGVPVLVMDRRPIHIFRWFQGDVGFTLIGELSRSEMIQIAESLIPSAAQ